MHKISPSQISVWQDCPTKWKFNYVDALKKKQISKLYFDVGNYFHELSHVYYQFLQAGYKAGDPFVIDMMMNRIRNDMNDMTEDSVEVYSTVSSMMSRFLSYQSPKIDKDIEVISVEHFIEEQVITPQGNEVILQGYVDLIYRDKAGNLRLRDHKTGTNPGNWRPEKLKLMPQLLFYIAIYKLGHGEIINQVEVSYINSRVYKTKQPAIEDQFKLLRHIHSDKALETYLEDILHLVDFMLSVPPYKRYSTECASCPYFDICQLEVKGMPTENLIKSNYEKVERDYGVELRFTSRDTQNTQKDSEGNKTDSSSDDSVRGRFVIDLSS